MALTIPEIIVANRENPIKGTHALKALVAPGVEPTDGMIVLGLDQIFLILNIDPDTSAQEISRILKLRNKL